MYRKGDIRSSLRALGPRGAVLGHTSDPTDQLGSFEGEVLELRFPEFGDCKAGALLYRRNGEWALLVAKCKQREHARFE